MTIAEEFSSWSKTLSVKDIPEKTQSTLKFLLKEKIKPERKSTIISTN